MVKIAPLPEDREKKERIEKENRIFRRIIRMNNEKDYPELCGIYKRDRCYYGMNICMGVYSIRKPAEEFVPEWQKDERFIDRFLKMEKERRENGGEKVYLPTKYEVDEFLQTLTEEEKRTAIYQLRTEYDTIVYVNANYLSLFLDMFESGDCKIGHGAECDDDRPRMLCFEKWTDICFKGFLFPVDKETLEQLTITRIFPELCTPDTQEAVEPTSTQTQTENEAAKIEDDECGTDEALAEEKHIDDEIEEQIQEQSDDIISEDVDPDYQVYRMNGGKPMEFDDYRNFDVNAELAKLFKDAPDVDWMNVPMRQLLDEHKITKEEFDSATEIQATGIAVGLHQHELKHWLRNGILEYFFFVTPLGWVILALIVLTVIFTLNGWN